MVIFEMLEMVFILIFFLLPYEILGMAGRPGQVRLYTNYANIFRNKAKTSRVNRVQAGTIRDKQGL
jgi:hypothetical protein